MIEDNKKYGALEAKIKEICDDLSKSVTRIFLRPDLHLAFLIAYCSVLHYEMDGEVNFGIIDCLLAGDSSQGKSKIAESLINFFRLGEIHDGGNAKRTGILGGLEPMGSKGKWFMKWGFVPKNDRKLVIMEEIKESNEEVIHSLRSMRSKKEAQIAGIVNRKAPARTRLIMISNPKSSIKDVESYDFGIRIIKELMIHLEDVRRLDFALVVGRNEINQEERDRLIKENIIKDPLYSQEAWRKLILWIWTRSVEQVVFEDGFRERCLELSKELYDTFTETIPLVDSGSMRHKLTKIAASLAAMTFNTDENNYEKLKVEKVHLEYAYNFLVRIYSSNACGYKAFSDDAKYSKVLKPNDITFLRGRLKHTKFPRDLVEQLLHAEEINRFDLMDWCDMVQEASQKLLGDFVRKKALFRNGFNYIKSPGFTKLLKQLLLENDFNKEANENENNIEETAEF